MMKKKKKPSMIEEIKAVSCIFLFTPFSGSQLMMDYLIKTEGFLDENFRMLGHRLPVMD